MGREGQAGQGEKGHEADGHRYRRRERVQGKHEGKWRQAAGMGVSAWTPPANGEGRRPPPCGRDTGQWNRDGWHHRPGEGKGVWGGGGGAEGRPGRGVEGGHEGVRGRWAPFPAEGKDWREGQRRVARGQWARPTADGKTTTGVMPTPPPLPMPIVA